MYQSNLAYADEFRRELPSLDFAAYRGIGRTALSEIAEPLPGWQGSGPASPVEESTARNVLAGFLGPEDLNVKYSRAYVPSEHEARCVFAALTAPRDYEIVEPRIGSDLPRNLLGFDLGYWDG